jgi:hypothetical protein
LPLHIERVDVVEQPALHRTLGQRLECVRACMYVYVCVYVCACMCVCVFACVTISACAYVYACFYARVTMCVCSCVTHPSTLLLPLFDDKAGQHLFHCACVHACV